MENNVTQMSDAQIKLTNENLNNFGFQQALGKLRTMPFGTKTAYKISFIGNHVDRHVKQGREVFQKIAKKFAKLDENENLIPEKDENGNPIPGSFLFKDDDSRDLFNKEQEEFMTTEHIIPKHKLSVDELEGTRLSANDISALSPLFSDLD